MKEKLSNCSKDKEWKTHAMAHLWDKLRCEWERIVEYTYYTLRRLISIRKLVFCSGQRSPWAFLPEVASLHADRRWGPSGDFRRTLLPRPLPLPHLLHRPPESRPSRALRPLSSSASFSVQRLSAASAAHWTSVSRPSAPPEERERNQRREQRGPVK